MAKFRSAQIPPYLHLCNISFCFSLPELKGPFMECSDLPWRVLPGLWFHALQSHPRQLHLGFLLQPISHRAIRSRYISVV